MTYIRNKLDFSLPSLRQILLVAFFMSLPVFSMAGTVELPQTGQTTSYDEDGNVIDCTGTGQDGDIQAGVAWPDPRFTNNGDSTMTDNLTGLVWVQDANLFGGTKTWQSALDYVARMNDGAYDNFGYTNWRLPNINELESLVNAGESSPATWLNGQGFTNVQSQWYWSSTNASFLTSVWIGSMYSGSIGLTWEKIGTGAYFWPVRTLQEDGGQVGSSGNSVELPQTGQTTCSDENGTIVDCAGTGQDGDTQTGVAWPDPRFTDNGDSTITDNLTGLVWTQDANLSSGTKTWQEALDYVVGMNSGTYANFGYTDWLLPNRKELFSLIDHSQYSPALPSGHPFTNVQSDIYWSSTSYSNNTSYAWNVDIGSGHMIYDYLDANDDNKTSNSYFWPVRAGSGVPSIVNLNPTTGIKANGSDSSITIGTSEQLDITISLDPGSYSGTSANWYIVVNTPSGWQSFNLSQMDYSTSGFSALLQDVGLITFDSTEIFSSSSLSEGTYTYYFAVELCGQSYYDSVSVTVADASFSYYIDTFTVVSGSNTFTDEFDDGEEPPSGPEGASTYITSPSVFPSDVESDGVLNLNSDYAVFRENTDVEDEDFGEKALKVSLRPLDNKYYFNSGSGGSLSIKFIFANGINTNTEIGLQIWNRGFPFVEGVFMGLNRTSSGRTIAYFDVEIADADDIHTSDMDISDLVTGISEVTLKFDISTTDVVTASLDFGSNGSFDLPGSYTFKFTGESYGGIVSVGASWGGNSAPTGFTASASGDTLSLSWNAVSGADGYYVYYGLSSGNYLGSVDLGNTTSQSFSSIPDGTYYFVVTAYGGSEESGYSNETSVTVSAK